MQSTSEQPSKDLPPRPRRLNRADLASFSQLLDQALSLEPEAREQWLRQLPAEHSRLLPMLREALARANTRSGLLLDRLPQLGELRSEGILRLVKPGDRVGPYELIRELGSGGMAEVWLARRADGAYRRDVALKLPKLTRLRKSLQRHYERERDILASLEHPNIARLYDAGFDPDGLPYLALEYVQGQALTAWCDARSLGLRERLELLLQVMEAVKYAHERQVIHRDLKPSNVFVTASGEVRLLDFGIAKLLEDDEADGSLFHLYTRALTPDYASPELLRGEAVDSRADVYSLGALLYELLTGDRPYRLTAAMAQPSQMAATLERLWIAKPSESIVPGAGQARATTDDRLVDRLRGYLDAIALKALALLPAERYGGVAEFAADLNRYLKGERVAALPERMTQQQLAAQLARNPNVRVRHQLAVTQNVRTNEPATKFSRKVDVSVLLVSVSQSEVLWSRNYAVTLRDGYYVEDEIATTILEGVRAALDRDTPAGGWRLKVEIGEH